jgi:hypothetical protein
LDQFANKSPANPFGTSSQNILNHTPAPSHEQTYAIDDHRLHWRLFQAKFFTFSYHRLFYFSPVYKTNSAGSFSPLFGFDLRIPASRALF